VRHYATSQKVAGSSPDEVDFYSLPNPFSRTIAPGSTKPLTEMSTKKLPRDKVGRPRRLTTLWDSTACSRDSFNFFFYTRWKKIWLHPCYRYPAAAAAAYIPTKAKGQVARNEQFNIVCFQATSSDRNICHVTSCKRTKFPEIMEFEVSAPLTFTSATGTYHEPGKSILHSTRSMEQGRSREPDSRVAGHGIWSTKFRHRVHRFPCSIS
jgi:hypothetical protein